jgi:hypothetical protein
VEGSGTGVTTTVFVDVCNEVTVSPGNRVAVKVLSMGMVCTPVFVHSTANPGTEKEATALNSVLSTPESDSVTAESGAAFFAWETLMFAARELFVKDSLSTPVAKAIALADGESTITSAAILPIESRMTELLGPMLKVNERGSKSPVCEGGAETELLKRNSGTSTRSNCTCEDTDADAVPSALARVVTCPENVKVTVAVSVADMFSIVISLVANTSEWPITVAYPT